MDVVALVSGGKDSCLAMLECVQAGHRVVCLGHICCGVPEESLPSDSFMYQFEASEAVDAVAAALALPLIRVHSSGVASSTALHYVATEGAAQGDVWREEVEALRELLTEVKKQHPTVAGVCSGAILSTYQRTRIESVCTRVGVTSLCYLWQRSQQDVLDKIVDAGIDAVLVKTAAVGLEPAKHLGKSVAALRGHFQRLNELYDFHVCGEGGEYETFTLDCPLFRKRIVLDQTEVVERDADSAYLRILAYHLEDKLDAECVELVGQTVQQAAPDSSDEATDETTHGTPDGASPDGPPEVLAGQDGGSWDLNPYQWCASDFFPYVHRDGQAAHADTISGADALVWATQFPDVVRNFWPSGLKDLNCLEETIEQQMGACLVLLSAVLSQHGMQIRDATYIRLGLQSMDDFSKGNDVYCKFFGIHPPSRSCVQLPIAKPDLVTVDAFALRGSHEEMLAADFSSRFVLHVQSISHWAPTCIGPYSQAQAVSEHMYLLAGQIGLVPGTMSLPPVRNASVELDLCLRHCAAILDVLPKGGSSVAHAIHFVIYVSMANCDLQSLQEDVSGKARTAAKRTDVLLGSAAVNAGYPRKSLSQKQEEHDARQAKAMASFTGRIGFVCDPSQESSDEADDDELSKNVAAPFAVVFVPKLPRNCEMEVEMHALSEVAYTRYAPERTKFTEDLELGVIPAWTGGSRLPWPNREVNGEVRHSSYGRATVDLLSVPGALVVGNVSASFHNSECSHERSLVVLARKCVEVMQNHHRRLRLAQKHLHQIRIFLPIDRTLPDALARRVVDTVQEGVLRCFDNGDTVRPALSVVPCEHVFSSDGREDLVLQCTAYDLHRIEADMWVHDGGHV